MQELKEKINRHGYEIETLQSIVKESLESNSRAQEKTANAITDLTHAVNKYMAQQEAESKRIDKMEDRLSLIDAQIVANRDKLVVMEPIFKGIQGLAWKAAGYMLILVLGSSIGVAAAIKLAG